jgi:hypothetical protein
VTSEPDTAEDVASDEQLTPEEERAEAVEGIRRGLESAARGEGLSVGEAFAELRARLHMQ